MPLNCVCYLKLILPASNFSPHFHHCKRCVWSLNLKWMTASTYDLKALKSAKKALASMIFCLLLCHRIGAQFTNTMGPLSDFCITLFAAKDASQMRLSWRAYLGEVAYCVGVAPLSHGIALRSPCNYSWNWNDQYLIVPGQNIMLILVTVSNIQKYGEPFPCVPVVVQPSIVKAVTLCAKCQHCQSLEPLASCQLGPGRTYDPYGLIQDSHPVLVWNWIALVLLTLMYWVSSTECS